MSTNMELWNRVSKTDPHHVKPITGKQYSGNSPKPYYIVQRLTEEFGPCGIGWGFEVVSERFERFSDTDTLHVALVSFWYEMEGSPRRAVFQQMGQTKASYVTNSGKFMLDEDAPKKSVTDALVKCASYLGFAGDIFSGRWDDSKYVESLKREFSEPKVKAPGHESVAKTVLADNDPIDPEIKLSIELLADRILDRYEKGEGNPVWAYELIEAEKLDNIQKIYLSTLLPAAVRNPITAESRKRREKEHA